ncbi:helix-turn-helix transcriptional regulator [Kitasatospora sp. NPDC047058]|uniref:response regulator transcription factor n=1 Tax=Kitasatospora sp. NPDC047058 TaxID=3155620 RepID=UPI0033E936B3
MSRPLTGLQAAVLQLVAEGFTNAQIGHRLGLTEDAVESHLSRLRAKVGARDRANLVHIAYQQGILAADIRRHGDHAGYRQHETRGERPCPACRAAETAYKRAIRNRARSAA